MKLIFALGLVLTSLSCGLFAGEPDKSQFSVKDFEELNGVLFWRIQIPNDVTENESYGMFWYGDIEKKKKEPSLVFKNVKAGTWVKVFLSVNAFRNGDNTDFIRFSYKFRDEQGKLITRSGKLNVPNGYHDLFSHMHNGEITDDGWLLMLQGKKEKSTYAKSCFLKLDYVAAD